MIGKFLKGLLTGTLVSALGLGVASVVADLPPSMTMLDLVKTRVNDVTEAIQNYRHEQGWTEGAADGQSEEPPKDASPDTSLSDQAEPAAGSEAETGSDSETDPDPQTNQSSLMPPNDDEHIPEAKITQTKISQTRTESGLVMPQTSKMAVSLASEGGVMTEAHGDSAKITATEQAPAIAESLAIRPVIESMRELMGSAAVEEISTSPEQPEAPEAASLSSGFGS